MSRKILLLLLSFFVCYPTFASGAHGSGHSSHSSKSSKSAKSDKAKTEHVRGYTKKNDTYVAPYDRSQPGTLGVNRSAEPFVPKPYRKGRITDGYTPDSSVHVTSSGKIKRSTAAKDAFKRQQPCPANGKTSGSCPGYVIDHIRPLECGGPDAPSNMQWQTKAEGKAKDKTERLCRV